MFSFFQKNSGYASLFFGENIGAFCVSSVRLVIVGFEP